MAYSVVLTGICILSFFLGSRNKGLNEYSLNGLREAFLQSFASPFSPKSIYWFLFFGSFLLLPYFWGLTFLLKSDMNVLVIIGGLVWDYYWSRTFILFR
ncbi:hypothetical protein LEP1GSC058_2953 [Leptospira fainei serovar Hurstbridge str. BUT 6]|uniref:Uncharacterized protein n=1 Tax=Leptospira fainei serovar Hurstbridge str. BUT 6 TaxID=1193011 RepID=S3USI8_9LEPT|nr:hypothetical protein [Leptospira fainei]EPG73371.1 hypothetical protein LEP1GSC058_2953 [Leptospira fainei serovar Hurstbridge str. BUT 6]